MDCCPPRPLAHCPPCPLHCPPPLPAAKSASGVFAVLASSASHYLPASLSLRRRGSTDALAPPPPPPISVPIQLLSQHEASAEATDASSIEQLLQACSAAAGVPPAQLRVCVQGERRGPLLCPPRCWRRCAHVNTAAPPCSSLACCRAEEQGPTGLGGLLRVANRQRMARGLHDITAFLLVPEGLGRELRGRGLAAWARENVGCQLRAPPPGTVRVSADKDPAGAAAAALGRLC